MDDKNCFHAQLDIASADNLARLVFADYLTEQDDPLADGYRAMGMLKLHAVSDPTNGIFNMVVAKLMAASCYFGYPLAKWHIGRDDNYLCHDYYSGHFVPCLLPPKWFAKITELRRQKKRIKSHLSDWWQTCDSRREADDLIATGFVNLTTDEKVKLIKW